MFPVNQERNGLFSFKISGGIHVIKSTVTKYGDRQTDGTNRLNSLFDSLIKELKKNIKLYTFMLLVIVILMSICLKAQEQTTPICSTGFVVVDQGDTLFEIASNYCHGDPRNSLEWIKHINHLQSSTIYSGQLLKLSETQN